MEVTPKATSLNLMLALYRPVCIHGLNVSIIVLCSLFKLTHISVDVCDGAVCICIANVIPHPLGDLQHTLQVLDGSLLLALHTGHVLRAQILRATKSK